MSSGPISKVAPGSSSWKFPQRYFSALQEVQRVTRDPSPAARRRQIELIVLDLLHRERIMTWHQVREFVDIRFELGGRMFRLACAWNLAPLAWEDLEKIRGRYPTENIVVLSMSGFSASAVQSGMTRVSHIELLQVLEGRSTWRELVERVRAA